MVFYECGKGGEMKVSLVKSFVAAFFSLIVISGCATTQNLLDKEYTKETVPDRQTSFTQLWAVEDEGEFRVSGKLRVNGSMAINVPSFVEVALLDKNGVVIDRQKVSYHPGILNGSKGHREASFIARFPVAPPNGTIIRLSNVD